MLMREGIRMAAPRYVLAVLLILAFNACSRCAADVEVRLGSDLGVAQQVSQVQRKLHDTQEKLQAAEVRSETLEKHAEETVAELNAAKEAAEAELELLKKDKSTEEAAASSKLSEASAKVKKLEHEVESLSASRDQLEAERTNLLKLVEEGKKAEQARKKVKVLEEEKAKLQERAEKAEESEAAQRKVVTQLKEEVEGLRKEAAEAAEKLAAVEAALSQAQAELSAKDQVLSGWLPAWAAAKINPLQETILVHWFKHGHPVYRKVVSSVSATTSTAHELAKPHMKLAHLATARIWESMGRPVAEYAQATHQKWMPIVTAEWAEHVTPWTEKAHRGVVAAYNRGTTMVGPHVQRVQRGLSGGLDTLRQHPQYQAVSAAAAPHVRWLHQMAKPLVDAAKVALGAAAELHRQAVDYTLDKLSSHSLTAAYATTKNARVMVYILLALPAVLILSSYPSVSKKLPKAESLAKKRRKLVPGKPGNGSAMGKRPSGTQING